MFYGSMRRVAVGAAAAALAVLAGGCGPSAESAAPQPAAPQPRDGAHEHGAPATAQATAQATAKPQGSGSLKVKKGTFKPLPGRPAGYDKVKGTARLEQRGNTKVTLSVSGLRPGVEYTSHLHAKKCSVEKGGPHFKFDPKGGDEPPNEVHLRFIADPKGQAKAEAYNNREVGDRAPSIVIHPAADMTRRIACADFR
ncbi:superoxide dismutase family protein [Actinomadura craniellae]|uniref:Superoxide dismutase family protein n=1 Tax=Actinomadura craniellae TaxID=2231787 RepID=A0A365GZF6_9ACTN|nr:superoxide dismutase family protein [Actinomadura craniellae]RAY12176.1 superoxide dismutase family protein [Actinomadura craniellae]